MSDDGYPWEEVSTATAVLRFVKKDGSGLPIEGQFQGVSSSPERARDCCHIAFRAMLDKAGIDWRNMIGDGDDQPDPGRS